MTIRVPLRAGEHKATAAQSCADVAGTHSGAAAQACGKKAVHAFADQVPRDSVPAPVHEPIVVVRRFENLLLGSDFFSNAVLPEPNQQPVR